MANKIAESPESSLKVTVNHGCPSQPTEARIRPDCQRSAHIGTAPCPSRARNQANNCLVGREETPANEVWQAQCHQR
jgi:hypothetical protein